MYKSASKESFRDARTSLRKHFFPMTNEFVTPKSEPFKITIRYHNRPITDLQFNRDGDLLFTASKDPEIFLCNASGEALGVYQGHEGAVNSVSVSWDSKTLASGSSDRRFMLWDVESGKLCESVLLNSSVKNVFFYPSSDTVLITCDDSYSQKPVIAIYDRRSNTVVYKHLPSTTPTSSIADITEKHVVYSDIKGFLRLVDHRMESILLEKKLHNAKINKIRPSWCSTFFITASSDTHSKIVDFEGLEQKKSFLADEPLNDAAVFGTNDKVICAGGMNARDVTLTRGKKEFDVYFYDIVTQKYVGCFSPHFGTINAVAMHPSSEMFCSGGEDAMVCVMKFGKDFYEAPFTNLYG